MMRFTKTILMYFAIAVAEGKLMNFLFIIVDDLRPVLGCYGDKKAHTPNIDFLAEGSTVFTQAFAQQALCAPSRNSLLTSRRPDTLKLYDFYEYWRTSVGNFTTLPQHLKNNGYETMSIGKVFHPGLSSNRSDDSPYSWTDKPFHPYTDKFKNAAVCSDARSRNLICPVDLLSMPNKTLPDIESKNAALKFLRNRFFDEKPFFLAVGFQKPHIPLKFPYNYLEMHPIEKFHVEKYYRPDNLSSVNFNPFNDLRKRDDVKKLKLNFPWEKIPIEFGRRIIQSYYASVTFIDHLIGELLNELNSTSLKNNTAVILTSDHGWSLGEHAEWAKYSNFDVALRVPLILKVPGPKKAECEEIVELLDLFPTIAELSGFPIPDCAITPKGSRTLELCGEGSSLIPLMNTERFFKEREGTAFSQYPRPGLLPKKIPNSDEPRLKEIKYMGYTVRTTKFRYVVWVRFSHKSMKPNWKMIIAEELYNHLLNPDEYLNVADDPVYSDEKLKLRTMVREKFQ